MKNLFDLNGFELINVLEPVFTAKRDVFLPHLACLLR